MVRKRRNPGNNRARIHFYDARVTEEVQNVVGEWEQRPKVAYSAWAEVFSISGREFQLRDKDETELTWRLKIRNNIILHEEMWVEIDGRTADVVYLTVPIDGWREVIIKWRS